MAVMVLSFDSPLELNKITPVAAVASFTESLRFPAGEVIKPESETVIRSEAAGTLATPEEITVVPSHNLTSMAAFADTVS